MNSNDDYANRIRRMTLVHGIHNEEILRNSKGVKIPSIRIIRFRGIEMINYIPYIAIISLISILLIISILRIPIFLSENKQYMCECIKSIVGSYGNREELIGTLHIVGTYYEILLAILFFILERLISKIPLTNLLKGPNPHWLSKTAEATINNLDINNRNEIDINTKGYILYKLFTSKFQTLSGFVFYQTLVLIFYTLFISLFLFENKFEINPGILLIGSLLVSIPIIHMIPLFLASPIRIIDAILEHILLKKFDLDEDFSSVYKYAIAISLSLIISAFSYSILFYLNKAFIGVIIILIILVSIFLYYLIDKIMFNYIKDKNINSLLLIIIIAMIFLVTSFAFSYITYYLIERSPFMSYYNNQFNATINIDNQFSFKSLVIGDPILTIIILILSTMIGISFISFGNPSSKLYRLTSYGGLREYLVDTTSLMSERARISRGSENLEVMRLIGILLDLQFRVESYICLNVLVGNVHKYKCDSYIFISERDILRILYVLENNLYKERENITEVHLSVLSGIILILKLRTFLSLYYEQQRGKSNMTIVNLEYLATGIGISYILSAIIMAYYEKTFGRNLMEKFSSVASLLLPEIHIPVALQPPEFKRYYIRMLVKLLEKFNVDHQLDYIINHFNKYILQD